MGRIDPDGSLGIGTAAVLNNVLSHHRDSDGGGYPSGPGIDDSAVPVGAHIVKAADVSDAATNPIHPRINGRQKIRDPKGLISEFEKNAGKLYHPEVAEIFCREIRDPNGVLSSSNWATR
jgi:HD-GYP domain-containing protein (c-di-GMP phosphodiesterase class II)